MQEPLVEISQGKLHGKIETDYRGGKFYSFKGIPYAQPPLGKLRFKAPLPANKWTGTFEALCDGNACYQYDIFIRKSYLGDEDCLYLNIFTKSLPLPNTELDNNINLKPVMVFIHGGAFTSGTSDSGFYGPEFLLTQDIVLVAFNYRLGLLGFLSFDDPQFGVPGNAGIKDCILALKWIQMNAKKFNGDPNNVTVFGESAGAAIVHLLILSPLCKNLFHRAILQSGCALNPWALGRKFTLEKFRQLGADFIDFKHLLEHLQTISVEQLYQYQLAIKDRLDPDYKRYLVPVIEDLNEVETAVITKSPIDIIQTGDYNHVPTIFGHTSREGLLGNILPPNPKLAGKIQNVEGAIPHTFNIRKGTKESRRFGQKLLQYYCGEEGTKITQNSEGLCDMAGDTCFTYGIWNAIYLHSARNQEEIFVYEMTVESQLNILKTLCNTTKSGVCHGDDLGYLFKTPTLLDGIELGSVEDIYIQRFVQLWSNFAKYGNPTPPNLIADKSAIPKALLWTIFRTEIQNVLDIGNELNMRNNYQPQGVKFLKEALNAIRPAGHL